MIIMNADELIAGATNLRPILERNADCADRDRRLPEETVNAMHEAGVFRILTPRCFGGCEADLGTLVEVVGQISQGCCSAGWLTLLMQSCTWLAALYPEQAQEEVFASGPDARAAGVLA
ncbi:MAG TPA: acyl-CoA dehydrogenase family protein, partial [Pseudonocardiaceae bacterium]|nr:acyl-CoA dehydrogenase family protein [Pseudonocardiaceae bacterium]